MKKEQILSGIGEDPDKPNIFIKSNVSNHSYHQFLRFWRRSGLAEVYCITIISFTVQRPHCFIDGHGRTNHRNNFIFESEGLLVGFIYGRVKFAQNVVTPSETGKITIIKNVRVPTSPSQVLICCRVIWSPLFSLTCNHELVTETGRCRIFSEKVNPSRSATKKHSSHSKEKLDTERPMNEQTGFGEIFFETVGPCAKTNT